MAHPCRVQVPLALQCIFLPSTLLNGECSSPWIYKSGKWGTGRLNSKTRFTHFGRGWSESQTLWAAGWLRLWEPCCGKGQPHAPHGVESSLPFLAPQTSSVIPVCAVSDCISAYQMSPNCPLHHHFWSDFNLYPSARLCVTNLITKMACYPPFQHS